VAGSRQAGGKKAGRSRRLWWWPLAVLVACTAVALGSSGAKGGFSGSIVNAGDAAQTGTLLTAGTSGGTTECDLGTTAYSPISVTNTAPCSGGLFPQGKLPVALTTSTTSTSIKADGSLSSTAASLVATACGPVQMANSTLASDPQLVRGDTFTYGQTGPLGGSKALGLNGSSAYTADVNQVAGPATSSYTELIWFKATTGGTLMGFADTQTPTGVASWDKMLWVDNTGHVVYGVYPGSTVEVTSTKTYADGNWHLAVATLNTTNGLTLYVDGAVQGTNTTTKSAQAYNGYWHLGWDNVTSGWADSPTDPYFTGSLADAAVLPSALSAAQVTALYGSTTQAAWAVTLGADAPTDTWTLGDSGTGVYTGAVPGVTPAPCAMVDATIGLSSPSASCIVPASNTACGAPAGTTTLATIGASGTTALKVAPTLTTPITVTTTVERDLVNTTTLYPNATGLHLSMSLSIVAVNSSFSATLNWPGENVEL
jgi:hypothetical protein